MSGMWSSSSHSISVCTCLCLSVYMQDVNARIPDKSEFAGTPEDGLRQMVQRQVEYYFSRENLMSDHYLSEWQRSAWMRLCMQKRLR